MTKFDNITSGIGCVGLLIHGCLCIFFGGSFLIVALFIFFFSEREAAHNYYLKEFAKNNYVETNADSVLPENDGKLVLVHGKTSTEDSITDSVFNVSVDKSMCLNRNVQMYQWAETRHEHTSGSGKSRRTYYTYSYAKGWHRDIINSSHFHDSENHKNPRFPMILSEKTLAQNIKVGAYKISSDKVCSLSSEETIFIKPDKIKIPINTAFLKGNCILYNIYDEINIKNKSKTSLNSSDDTHKGKNQVDEKSPKIGDIRIFFTKNPVCTVTVLAKQEGESLVSYKTTKNLEIFEAGLNTITVDNLFNKKEEKNQNIINKIITFIFIFVGVYIFTNIYEPKKNNFKGCFLSLAISFALITSIIGIIWFPYYPSYAISSFGLTFIGIFFTVIILFFSFSNNFNKNKTINNYRNYNNRNYN